jgi:hypothetical protein
MAERFLTRHCPHCICLSLSQRANGFDVETLHLIILHRCTPILQSLGSDLSTQVSLAQCVRLGSHYLHLADVAFHPVSHWDGRSKTGFSAAVRLE